MKKFFRILLSVVMTVMMSINFVSCDNDDDDSASNPLVGSWQECEEDGTLRNDETDAEVLHVTFNSDGTGSSWEVYHGRKDEKFPFKYTYEISGSSGYLHCTYADGEEERVRFTLENGILALYEFEDDTTYFKKVSSKY